MKISREEVQTLLQTVKIEESENEIEKMIEDIYNLESWLEPLFSIDTTGVSPTLYNYQGNNVQREDKVQQRENQDKLWEMAENFEEGFYRVPPIIEY